MKSDDFWNDLAWNKPHSSSRHNVFRLLKELFDRRLINAENIGNNPINQSEIDYNYYDPARHMLEKQELINEIHDLKDALNAANNDPIHRTAPDQPEQFSREDMWKVAAIGDLDSQWFEKWITEYIKNKK